VNALARFLVWSAYGVMRYLAAIPAFPASEARIFVWVDASRAATGLLVAWGVDRWLDRAFAHAERRRWAIAAVAAFAGSVLWSVLDRVLLTTGATGAGAQVPWAHLTHGVDLEYFFVMTAWTAVAAGLRESARERIAREALLEQRVAAREAERRALAARLQPHFLFNTLNTIRALIDEDSSRAREVVTRLAAFLRRVVTLDAAVPVTLAWEIELAEGYLDIERGRFEDQLSVELEAATGSALALVPPMILQPLVENAVLHGGVGPDGVRRVRIRSALENGQLAIEVANLGSLGRAGDASGSSLGLALTRERLEHLYGPGARVTLTEDGDWVRARIEVDRPRIATGGSPS
jgi:histidine kinase